MRRTAGSRPHLDDPGGVPDVVAETIAAEESAPTGRAARRGLVAALVYCGLCTSVVGSLGALLIPTIAEDLSVDWGTAQWVLTAALLTGAVATPVLGSLSDGPHRRSVLLGTLGLVLIGSLLAATATTFAQLVTGRALQGLTFGIIPMATATARAHLPPERARGAVAALSITTVTGAGLSFSLTGLVVHVWDYRVAFWCAVVFTALALVAVWTTAPGGVRGSTHEPARLDWPGSLLLAGILTSLLLAISQGSPWGWGSPAVVSLFAVAVLLFPLWVVIELRTKQPLIHLRSLAIRDVALANMTGLVLGAMLFAGSSAVSQLVQTPRSAGYGFGLSLLAAGVVLLPISLGSQLANRVVRRLGRRIDARRLLSLGPVLVGLDMAALALSHDLLWQVLVGIFIQGIAVGASFVLMPAMILRAVPADQTGSAVALNQVLRTLGGAIGSAGIGAVLASATVPGSRLPLEHGFTLAFTFTAVGCALLTATLLVAPKMRSRRDRPEAPLADRSVPLPEAGCERRRSVQGPAQ